MLEPEINDLPALTSEELGAPGASPLGTWESQPPDSSFNQCFHQITDGHRCHAPAVRGEYFCRHHLKRPPLSAPATARFDLPPITDRESARAVAIDIASRVAANSLDVQRARTLLSSLRVVLSTLPPLPRPKPEASKPGTGAPSRPAGSPLGARGPESTGAESWARIFIARAEAARTGAPDPFDEYPGDLLPKDGKVHVGHSCFAPPGWKPASEIVPEPTDPAAHSCAGVSTHIGGMNESAQPQYEGEQCEVQLDHQPQPATLATVRACVEPAGSAPPPSLRQLRTPHPRTSHPRTSYPRTSYHGDTMRISSAAPLSAPLYFAIAALALSPSPVTAQTAKPAAHAATHAAAAHSATHAHDPAACVKLPELSSKIPALPAGAPCAHALYTMTVVPDVRLDYAAPVEGDLAKELGIEPVSFSLAYIDTHTGAGELAQPHKFYTVKYTGYLADGSKFDASDDHPEKSFTFQAGAHQVVAGWDTGFAGMHVGGRRRLFVPFQLAYGPNGRPPAIPARAELIFDMELVSQSDAAPAPRPEPAAAVPPSTPPAAAAPKSAEPPAAAAPKPQ